MSSVQKYLGILLATPVFILVAMTVTIFTVEDEMPAPRFSTSESFNEKARWIHNLPNIKCDVLIIGSSMALNNVDGSSLKKLTQGKSVLNLGSWGLTNAETATLLKYVAPLCKPKVIIFATFYGDFDNQIEKKINWELFESYLKGQSTVITYLKSMDPSYYWTTYIERRSLTVKGRSIYQSLIFDETGSIIFDCDNFEISPARWNAQNTYLLPLSPEKMQATISGLIEIENVAREHHSGLLVISTPLRKVAKEKFSTPEITRLWEEISRSVNDSGGKFVNVGASYNFIDEQFADFAHLNRCGANKVIEVIAPSLINLLRNVR